MKRSTTKRHPLSQLSRVAVAVTVPFLISSRSDAEELKLYLVSTCAPVEMKELSNGSVFPQSELGSGLKTIVAEVSPSSSVGQVHFFTSPTQNKPAKIEKQFPFALFGDKSSATLNGATFSPGSRYIKAVVYGKGTKSQTVLAQTALSFSITENTAVPTPAAATQSFKGIAAWRKKDASGASCASCHAPDAYDLAMLNFSDETILRRAKPHVGDEVGQEILSFVKSIRGKFGITNPPSPLEFRPFQPGGQVLPGATAQERDKNFGLMLRDEYDLRLAQPIPIKSLAEAKHVRDEVMALDLKRMKIGIPFNRWAEDGFHGTKHQSIAEWLPISGRTALPGKEQQWHGIQDTYLNNPSDENFWKMYDAVETHTKNQPLGGDRLWRDKYHSVLLAQHLFRKARLNGLTENDALNFFEYTLERPNPEKAGLTTVRNPFWDVGDTARVFMPGNNVCTGRLGSCINLVPALYDALTKTHSMRDQLPVIRLSWMWLGWMFDQGMQRTSQSNSTKFVEYFRGSLLENDIPELPLVRTNGSNGFPIHTIFVFTRKQFVQSFEPTALPDGNGYGTRRHEQELVMNFSEFQRHDFHLKRIPKNSEHATLYRHAVCNSYVTSLYLLDEAQSKGERVEARWKEKLPGLLKFLDAAGPSCSGDIKALVSRIMKRPSTASKD